MSDADKIQAIINALQQDENVIILVRQSLISRISTNSDLDAIMQLLNIPETTSD